MSKPISISFAKFAAPKSDVAVVFATLNGKAAPETEAVIDSGLLDRVRKISGFSGKVGSATETIAPQGSELDRIVIAGAGNPEKFQGDDWLKLGGLTLARLNKAKAADVILALPDTTISPESAGDFAMGLLLRAYGFDKYKTKANGDDENGAEKTAIKITIHVADPTAARKALAVAEAIAGGVILARDLVNEPANALGTIEFVERVKDLEKLGVKTEILTEKEMKKLGMGSLLGVAQGSVRPPRLAIMKWNGGKAKDQPVAFVGKGVVFDSGGVSIKSAAGMEDMKGDMGGAAAVTGLMHALAARKAKANVIGIIGLVENMVDGNAQRPGDIVTSMSGQTIEVINTDAEGRLVLADALWYCKETYKPRFMVNLATLTGAVMVALGHFHAGLFSNDDELAGQLTGAGVATGERLWRMPLGDEYDKLIDSRFADMKNSSGRLGGSITAAQFLKRFVGDTPWAHLDIAGTAMGSPVHEYNQSWASGFGVRLLDRLVKDHFEA
ncbi:MAG: leucyl aminopeptidase [Phyllobacterium sp.]